MRSSLVRTTSAAAFLLLFGCGDSPTTPTPTGDTFTLSQAQFDAMVSRGATVSQANPGNASLKAFVDSTLQALQAGVQMQRVDVETNLTDKPLYFVGIHRIVNQTGGQSFSTWTLVGFEDPADFRSVIQTSGFAQASSGTAPSSVSGTIGDGSGVVNGQFLVVNADGTVTTYNYSAGDASFRSEASSAACPKTNPAPATVCTLETMHVKFNFSATQSVSSSFAMHGAVATEVAVPAMRLTYTP